MKKKSKTYDLNHFMAFLRFSNNMENAARYCETQRKMTRTFVSLGVNRGTIKTFLKKVLILQIGEKKIVNLLFLFRSTVNILYH